MNVHDLRPAELLERVDGAARLAWEVRGGATALADLYHRAPCHMLFPQVERDDLPLAVLLTTSGGLTGGDKLFIDVDFGGSSRATVTTQAAEKIYRSTAGEACVDVRLKIGECAWSEWLMQETILFDCARFSRRTQVEVAETGALLAVESLVFGRGAMGEDFERGHVRDVWRVKHGGRLVWIDALRLEGDVGAQRRRPFGFGDAAGCATILYVSADAGRHLETARAAIAQTAVHGGATSFDGVLLVRAISESAAVLREGVAHVIAHLRGAIANLPQRLPRVWSV